MNNHTTQNGNQFCNTGAISVPATKGAATPYPSRIFVTGYSTNAGKVTLTLTGLNSSNMPLTDLLLVGPSGAAIVPFAGVGDSSTINGVNITLDDAASDLLPDGAPLVTGTFKPSAFGESALVFPAPAPLEFGYAQTRGSATLTSTFSGSAANGTWSLYAMASGANGADVVSGGWCVNISPQQVAVPNVVGDTQAAATTAITGAGLYVGPISSAYSSTIASGDVISEYPTAETEVNVGSAVSLVLSLGPQTYLFTGLANPTAGGSVSPSTGNYPANTVVPISATPNPGYLFAGWTGSPVAVANPNQASTTVTMGTAPETVTANFISTLSVSASSLNFGTVYLRLGTISIQSVTLKNLGSVPIADPFLSRVTGGDSKEFYALNLCPKSLPAHSSCTIKVGFVTGPYYNPQTATLSIMDNACGNPQMVSLSALVIDPKPRLSVSELSFGSEKEGSSSAAKTVKLTNVGATALLIQSIGITGADPPAFEETNPCPASLAPNTSCTIDVTFKPSKKASFSAELFILDNAAASPQKVTLSGKGN